MPADDPEPKVHRCLKTTAIQSAIGSFRDADDGVDSGIRSRHHRKQPFDLVRILDEFGPRPDNLSAQPNPHRLAVFQVPLPFVAAWSEQRIAMLHVAYRFTIGLGGFATSERDQHQAPAERSRKEQSQKHSHWNGQHTHDAGLDPPAKRTRGV